MSDAKAGHALAAPVGEVGDCLVDFCGGGVHGYDVVILSETTLSDGTYRLREGIWGWGVVGHAVRWPK